jgi:hypothetical protein
MPSVFEHIRKHLLDGCGYTAVTNVPSVPSLEVLRQDQWSDEFEALMRNRLLFGAFRYGTFRRQERGAYANTESAMRRLEAYCLTGNREHLVDVANLMMVEYLRGGHPTSHFRAEDDSPHHVNCH